MSAIDDMLAANAQHDITPIEAGRPTRRLAVVTCMDARIDVVGALAVAPGDAHVIRNAGGLPTDDVLRSVAISQRALGTVEVAIVQHTRCGMQDFDDATFRQDLADETGTPPPWDVSGFSDVRANVAKSIQIVRACPWLPHRDEVRGFVYDVDTAKLAEVR